MDYGFCFKGELHRFYTWKSGNRSCRVLLYMLKKDDKVFCCSRGSCLKSDECLKWCVARLLQINTLILVANGGPVANSSPFPPQQVLYGRGLVSLCLWTLSRVSAGAAGGAGMCAAPPEPQPAQTTPEGPAHQDHDGHPHWGDSCCSLTPLIIKWPYLYNVIQTLTY